MSKSTTRAELHPVYPAGTKLYKKALRSQFGRRAWGEHFKVKPIKRNRKDGK